MTIEILHIDAFASEPFKGNPAAVCLLDQSRSDDWMQKVAAEMNLSETAFLLPNSDGYSLRWFTPTVEVALCGHATLASAHALWQTDRLNQDQEARFHTLSGLLTAKKTGSRIEIDLPASIVESASLPTGALKTLGNINPLYSGRIPNRGSECNDYKHEDSDFLLELDSEEAVRSVRPDFANLKNELSAGVIITARSESSSYDFISRYFAPWWGINEDPVTGAAHCVLAPYWRSKLGKNALVGYQASARGGFVYARVQNDRALLSGEAVTVLHGVLTA